MKKDRIYRVLSLAVGLAGLLMILTDTQAMSTTLVTEVSGLVSIMIFILYGLGGTKLLSKVHCGPLLNEKVIRIFSTR